MRGTVVVIEVVLTVALIVSQWTDIGVQAIAAAALLALLGVLPPIRRRVEKRWRRTLFMMRRRRREPSAVLAPAFDVPAADTPARAVGVRWVGGRLITMIALDADAAATTVCHPTGVPATPGRTWSPTLIADCLQTFDVAVDQVDVISHGQRVTGPAAVAGAYHGLLGPLPAIANRTTVLVIRLSPAQCRAAIARRGGGGAGAVRSALIATRRIAAALAAAGLSARILDARGLADATAFLADGVPLTALDESAAELRHAATRIQTFAIAPAALAPVASALGWTHQAQSTTLALRLRPGPAGVTASGLLRITTSNRGVGVTLTGLEPLPERQFDALCATLPVASSAALDRELAWTALTRLPDVALPIRGCGQLIGADAAGHAVAMPLIGVGPVVAVGDQSWLWQLVIRAIATGARVHVHSRRRGYWSPLLATVADPRLLTWADAAPPDTEGDHRPILHVIDGDSAAGADEHVGPRCGELHVYDDAVYRASGLPTPHASLICVGDAAGTIDVTVGADRHQVAVVTAPAERQLLSPAPELSEPGPAPERTSPVLLQPAR